jgi:hypothetical protein
MEYWSDGSNIPLISKPCSWFVFVIVFRTRYWNLTSTSHDHEHGFTLSYEHDHETWILFSSVTENPGI